MLTDHATSGPERRRRRFSEELGDLSVRFAARPARLEEILEATQGRGFNLLLVLIALPFVTPIPLPGFSIPFGLIVAVLGARQALRQKPWLPRRLLARELPAGFLTKLLSGAGRVVRALEWFLRPRLKFLHEGLLYQQLAGVLLAFSGFYLLLPLPIPFANGLPAATVLLLSASALERDGLCFVAGCVMFGLTTLFFILLALGGAEAIEHFRRTLIG